MRIVALSLLVSAVVLFGQEPALVEAEGYGADRTEALENAKRSAVEQAAGALVTGFTQVDSFRLVRDVVSSRTQGYITSYTVLSEMQLPKQYRVRISASVTKSALQADIKALQAAMGGFRIMVWYDFRGPTAPGAADNYAYAADRADEFLSRSGLRYVERSVFDRLKEEARLLFPDTTQALTVAQHMAVQANVPVFWELANVMVNTRDMGAAGIVAGDGAVDLKAYDTYTAEGMGTAVGKSDSVSEYSQPTAVRSVIDKAVETAGKKLSYQMGKYLGDWVLNGKPYLLRFYGVTSYKTLRKLKDELKKDARFGGQMEVVSVADYSQMDVTFKAAADELADAILDIAARIPELSPLDVAGFFKNQVNFAMPGAKVPEEQKGVLPRQGR